MRNKRGVKNMSFIDKLEETLEDISYTENGARGFNTGKETIGLKFQSGFFTERVRTEYRRYVF